MTQNHKDASERHWLSVDDLRREPEIEARRRREFIDPPPVSALAGGGTTRRDFARLVGLGLAAAGCSRATVHEAIPFADKPVEMTPGVALSYATTCAGCSAACPLVVKVRDGRPIKVEGNRLSAATGGGTCAVGQATVLSLYDDRRLRGPLWHGEPTTWEELDRRVSERLEAARAAGGRIAVLTGTVVSPSSRALLKELTDHYGARWVSWDPISSAAVRRAHEAYFGRPAVPAYRFDLARAAVGLEADFLATWHSPVEHARGYGLARRLPVDDHGGSRTGVESHGGADSGSEMLWHAQIESRMSPTGANADLRVPVEPSEVGVAAAALLRRLDSLAGRASLAADDPPGAPAEALDRIAETLWANRGASVVVCGVADPSVQEVVCAINHRLDNYGRTVSLDRPSMQKQGDEEALSELIDEMGRGEVHAVLMWGANPAYQHPRAGDFADALERVALSVSFADRLDETASLADAVAPDHHFLEAWNDAEPVVGRLSLAQPTLTPLFDTRAAQASLLAWMGREPDWRGYLEQRWQREVFPLQDRFSDFQTFWLRSVQDGVVTLPGNPHEDGRRLPAEPRRDAGAAVKTVLASAADARGKREAGNLELVLYEKTSMRDGRWADVPWLQELPDPVSRVTWGNYAALAPSTAERLGLAEGDQVRLEVEGTAVAVPVALQPGQAVATVAVALGYGRRAAGPVGDGVGADAFPLVDVSQGLFRYHRSGVLLSPTGRRRPLAATQTHHVLEGRPIVHEATLAAWREDPYAGHPQTEAGPAAVGEGGEELPTLWEERHEVGHAWGMAVDLNACIGCAACVVACQAENNVPTVGPEEVRRGREMHWLRVDRYYRGSLDSPDTVFQPMMCQHCDHAPCETVCPVLATVHSSDGLNQQIYNRCVGTRYCANNCPYKVRRFNWFNYANNDRFDFQMNSPLGAMVLNPDVTVRSRGVMEKCSMCIQRIQAGKLVARDEGRRVHDGDIVTACQQACPTEALTFGDWMDPTGRLSHLGEDPRFYRVLESLGVRPSNGYLTKIRHRQEV